MKTKLIKTLAIIPMIGALAPISIACAQNKKDYKVSIEGDDYLLTDQTIKLTYKIDTDRKVDSIAWSSDDVSVATVDENGNVKGVSEGYVDIVVEAVISGNKYYSKKQMVVIDKSRAYFVEFLAKYSEFLDNFLASTKEYRVEPVGKYEDMSYHDQIIEKMILTKFSEYPNKYFLRIFTTKQRTFNFVTAGNTLTDMYSMLMGLYLDCLQELQDTQIYTEDYYLNEIYEINDDAIEYQVIAQTPDPDKQKYYLVDIRINKNSFIEKYENTTNSEVVEHQAENGCFELKYIEK